MILNKENKPLIRWTSAPGTASSHAREDVKTIAVSREDEIHQVDISAPHLVILGAGASRAAFPHGDRNGQQLPLMADFTQIVPVSDLLDSHGIVHRGQNLEDVYTHLYGTPELDEACAELEWIPTLRALSEGPTTWPQYRRLLDPKLTPLLAGLKEKDVSRGCCCCAFRRHFPATPGSAVGRFHPSKRVHHGRGVDLKRADSHFRDKGKA